MYIQHLTQGYDSDARTPSSLTAFYPTDGEKYIQNKPLIPVEIPLDIATVVKVDWDKVAAPRNTPFLQAMYGFIMQLTMRTTQSIIFGNLHPMVSLGIAMVAPSDAPVKSVVSMQTKLDLLPPEPLAIATALMAFATNKKLGIEWYIANQLTSGESSAVKGTIFELATVVMLAMNLNGSKTLKSVFDCKDVTDIGHLLDFKAQLVSLLGWDDQTPIVCPAGLYAGASPLLSFSAQNPQQVKDWTNGSEIPFLFPDKNMGPDIIALVQVGDKFVWLICRVKMYMQRFLKPNQLKHATNSISAERFYLTKARL